MTDHSAPAVLGLAVAFAIEDLAHTLDAYDAGSWSLLDLETLLVRRQEAIARLVQGHVEDPQLAQLCRQEVEAVYGSTMTDLRQAPPRKSNLARIAYLTHRAQDLRAGADAYVVERQRAMLAGLHQLDADEAEEGKVLRLRGFDPEVC
jgi:hypothetical protein